MQVKNSSGVPGRERYSLYGTIPSSQPSAFILSTYLSPLFRTERRPLVRSDLTLVRSVCPRSHDPFPSQIPSHQPGNTFVPVIFHNISHVLGGARAWEPSQVYAEVPGEQCHILRRGQTGLPCKEKGVMKSGSLTGIDVGYLGLNGSQVRTESENPAAEVVWAEGQSEGSEF